MDDSNVSKSEIDLLEPRPVPIDDEPAADTKRHSNEVLSAAVAEASETRKHSQASSRQSNTSSVVKLAGAKLENGPRDSRDHPYIGNKAQSPKSTNLFYKFLSCCFRPTVQDERDQYVHDKEVKSHAFRIGQESAEAHVSWKGEKSAQKQIIHRHSHSSKRNSEEETDNNANNEYEINVSRQSRRSSLDVQALKAPEHPIALEEEYDHVLQQQEFLLQPLRNTFQGKKCLVLDLDETLVHSSFKVCL